MGGCIFLVSNYVRDFQVKQYAGVWHPAFTVLF